MILFHKQSVGGSACNTRVGHPTHLLCVFITIQLSIHDRTFRNNFHYMQTQRAGENNDLVEVPMNHTNS